LWLLLTSLLCAADNVPAVVLRPSAKFAIPLTVAGKEASGIAVVRSDGMLEVFYAQGGEVAYENFSLTRGDSPQPGPNPAPNPQPSKIAFLYIIHESADNTPAQAKVMAAKPWKDEAAKLGIRCVIVDKDESVKQLPGATQRAMAVGLPAIVAVDKSGMAVAEKLPETADAMLATVKRLVESY
jgi:hypothetical protein